MSSTNGNGSTRKLYNHSLVGSYPEHELADIPGVWMYSARVLASSRPGDAVQLDPSLRDQYGRILIHYRDVGLQTATDMIWNTDLDEVHNHTGYHWDPFLFSELHHAVTPEERWKNIVKKMNDKNEFICLCIEKGWAVPKTLCFEGKHSFRGSNKIQFPCYLKVGCSASGAGVFYCENQPVLSAHISALQAGVDFQVQQPVADAVFLNVQYEVQHGKACRAIYTEQVLNGFSHAGNKYPSNYGEGPWDLCDPVAQYMVEQGMKGPFAFDVAVTDGKFILIECNPRFNGCTYYSRVAEKLHAKTWVARNLSVKARCLSEISLDGLSWDSAIGKGIVIISWGTVLQGKLGVLFAGNSEQECQALYEDFSKRNGKQDK